MAGKRTLCSECGSILLPWRLKIIDEQLFLVRNCMKCEAEMVDTISQINEDGFDDPTSDGEWD